MIPNTPRKRIDYVAKQFPKVLWETAYVVAHTVGGDRDGIERAMRDLERHYERSGLRPAEYFSPGGPHPHEALIPWVAKELNAARREVDKGRLPPQEFVDLVNLLEAKLPAISLWAEAKKPDLTRLSVADALMEVAKFEPDEAASVPQGKVIYRFKDGWTVQELTTAEQLDAEGEAVQNCLRLDSNGRYYLEDIEGGLIRIFSLRTPAGNPRVSMAYNIKSGHFSEIFAKQNTSLGASLEDVIREGGTKELWEAVQKYKPRVREFVIEKFRGDPKALLMINVPFDPRTTSTDVNLDLQDYDHPLPVILKRVDGSLVIRDYKYPLPKYLAHVGGNLYLSGYKFPLPEGLKSVGGYLELYNNDMGDYDHPLPEGLTSVGRGIELGSYKYPLPEGLTSVDGDLNLSHYRHALPKGLTSVGGELDLRGYEFPLPEGLKIVRDSLFVDRYDHPLPEGLERVGGTLRLWGYKHPLPEGLKSVGGTLDLEGYKFPLPERLTSVGEGIILYGYQHPLPKGLRRVGGNLTLEGYKFPLPDGLVIVDGDLNLKDYGYGQEYDHPLPAGLQRVGGDLSLRGYMHPLPEGFKSVGGNLFLGGYDYPLPKSLTEVGGNLINAASYRHPLPKGLKFQKRER